MFDSILLIWGVVVLFLCDSKGGGRESETRVKFEREERCLEQGLESRLQFHPFFTSNFL